MDIFKRFVIILVIVILIYIYFYFIEWYRYFGLIGFFMVGWYISGYYNLKNELRERGIDDELYESLFN